MTANASFWINGRFAPVEEAAIRVDDAGFAIGAGVFETLLASDGRLWRADRHHARLGDGTRRLGIEAPELDECCAVSVELLVRNRLDQGRARVRWTVSVGPPGGPATVAITATPAPPPPPQVTLWVASFPRNERGALAGIKATAYAENFVALAEANRHGADEALFLNTRGDLCEGATSNVFLVIGGVVRTPPLASGCLPGIARAEVLELCRDHGIPYREEPLGLRDADAAAEAFITSSLRGIVPVRAIGARELPEVPGPLSQRLQDWLEASR